MTTTTAYEADGGGRTRATRPGTAIRAGNTVRPGTAIRAGNTVRPGAVVRFGSGYGRAAGRR
ncbi:hypothetical protein [Streptomyces sp. PTD5-9]|uniref:hypothetical protein n=1 Tax=Streptomyces sp. PTD5-9 TaxID=3120150 RepID=UPI00300B11B2